MKATTELGLDIKIYLQQDKRMIPGKEYSGILRHDIPCEENDFDDYLCTFRETSPSTEGKRNEHVFRGEYVNITRRDDGTLRANFKTIKVGKDCSVDDYAFGAFAELRQALKSLVEEK